MGKNPFAGWRNGAKTKQDIQETDGRRGDRTDFECLDLPVYTNYVLMSLFSLG